MRSIMLVRDSEDLADRDILLERTGIELPAPRHRHVQRVLTSWLALVLARRLEEMTHEQPRT